ncbi:MAG: methyl-accepting chemotaxis protein [Actinomycetota bacterium]
MKLRTLIIAAFSAGVAITVGLVLMIVVTVSRQAVALSGIEGQADRVGNQGLPLLVAIKDMRWDVVQVQQLLTDVSATHDAKGFEEAEQVAARFRADASTAGDLARQMDLPEVAGAVDAAVAAFDDYHRAGVAMARVYVASGIEAGNHEMEGFDKVAETLAARMDALIEMVNGDTWSAVSALLEHTHEVSQANATLKTAMSVVGLLAVLGSVAIALLLGWHVARLFGALRRDVALVLDGRHDEPLGLAPDRKDEFGPIAQALAVFRRNAAEMAAMEMERRHHAEQAEKARCASLVNMADTVEVESSAAVENVAEEGERIRSTAGAMAESAVAVGEHCQAVAAAAEQSLRNAEAVAGAAEELSASIREIARQVAESNEVVHRVVDRAAGTTHTVRSLAQAMERIGDVAGLIAEIAQRTNMLALNATIEAARAGESGKGFAVVAGEVKNLANQTATSTAEISSQLDSLQAIGRDVASAIEEMMHSVAEVESVSSSIVAAVQQQDAATREIVRNVVQTSESAREVTSHIADVAAEAGSTGERASEVRHMLDDMAGRIRELRAAINAVVRTATPEVNRRRNPRVTVDREAAIHVGGQVVRARVADLSLCGSRLVEVPTDVALEHGTMTVDGLARPMPFRMIECRTGTARVRFDDAADAAELSHFIAERHREGRAA